MIKNQHTFLYPIFSNLNPLLKSEMALGKLLGHWKLESSENFEEYMKAVGGWSFSIFPIFIVITI